MRKHKRILSNNLRVLHKTYNTQNPKYTVGYSTFCKWRPFWVTFPSRARDSCLCKTHENFELLIKALHVNNIIKENNSDDILYLACAVVMIP